ncbi:MAG: 2-isopropylmalate synthase [Nitrospinae bacterium]|nr:2-isopropylmalate synthase [Nitrospinota bacterium]
MKNGESITIFDTTLRDGEQSPGFSMNIEEKVRLATQLARLKVDVIEAGFPIASEGDFEAVKEIARGVKGAIIAGLCRVIKKDIDRAWEALKYAERARIHTFVSTSDIHLKYQLKKGREEVLHEGVEAVRYARQYTDDVEFSAMDAVRSDLEYLLRVIEATIDAGATTINIPDTVGYAIPTEFGSMIRMIRERVPNIDKAVISVHCHNDLGLAVANSLAGIENGARQVECTINGIGERAGNASLEEVVMAIKTRRDYLHLKTGIKTKEIYKTSKLLSSITGIAVQPNKAIVGENAFAHESGIHQDGILKERTTYEIMTPESIGLTKSRLVLGKHSGRHAFSKRLEAMGFKLSKERLDRTFLQFKRVADIKKEIFDEDLEAIVEDEISQVPETFVLKYLQTTSGSHTIPTATIKVKKGDTITQDAAIGDGPVDATYKAIDRITGIPGRLITYSIRAVTCGKDAIGEVVIRVEFNGSIVIGRGASTDIVEASAKAYLNAVNKVVYRNKVPKVG